MTGTAGSARTHARHAARVISLGCALASRLHSPARMTRFDQIWEPLLVIVAAAMIWIGTL